MSRGRRNRPPSSSSSDPKRGRHKRSSSPETAAWERGHLIPERPPWLDAETYRRLAELRAEL